MSGRVRAVSNRGESTATDRKHGTHGAQPPRCWIATVSREHVQRGIAGSFAQACHGKATPLSRMRAGDYLAFYSPTDTYGDSTPCRRFTALARIDDGPVYPVDMGEGFVPNRRDVTFLVAAEAEIAPLIPALSFLPDKRRWGFPFRRGHFEIPAADMASIAIAMGCDLPIIGGDGDKDEAADAGRVASFQIGAGDRG